MPAAKGVTSEGGSAEPSERAFDKLTTCTRPGSLATLVEAADRTDVLIVHEGVPGKVPAADNETGTRMALVNLVKLVGAP